MLHYDSNSNAQDAQKPFIHPYDPAVEDEYETLIESWKQQLIDTTPKSPNKEYVKLAWMRLIDHYLDQQWLDSKQMLQCAQAWSARNSLSITEAVHTMNILSLKTMQRSLDARQELLETLNDPEMMIGFGLSEEESNLKPELFSHACLEKDQVHAPLLSREPCDSSRSSSCEEKVIAQLGCGIHPHQINDNESMDETQAIIEAYKDDFPPESASIASYPDEYTDDEDDYEENDLFYDHSPRLHSSMSTPHALSSFSDPPNLRRSTSWRQILPDDDASSTHSNLSQSDAQWKSWFGKRLSRSSSAAQNQEFANEKVEASDAFFATKNSKFGMVRSESSVSAFRPISNNLAPRCQQQYQQQVRTSASSFLHPKDDSPDGVKMMKSRSFPSKSALIASFKKPSSPPPIPQRERRSHSKIRSIVRKKVSFSKIFGGRKGSTSTTFTT